MNPKTILTEEGWDEVAPDCKGKDKDLKRALLFYWSLEDDDFDFRCKALGKIAALAGALKAANEVKADRDAVRHLGDVISASKSKQSELTKAKAEGEKAQANAAKAAATAQKKADAEAKQQEQEEEDEGKGGEKDEEDDVTGDYRVNLKNAFKRLKSSKELEYNFIVCDAKPLCGVIISKQRISSKHKAELTKITGGSKRYLKPGLCHVDGGKLVFDMEKPLPGLAAKLKKSFKYFTGLNIGVIIGDQSDEDEEEQPSAVAEAPAARPGAAPRAGRPTAREQEEEEQEARPSGAAASPPGRPTLDRAPEAWQRTQQDISAGVEQLKTAIRREFAEEAPDLIAEIDQKLEKLDGILDNLDDKLSESMRKANAAANPAARANELRNTKTILAKYIGYVKSEPLIAGIDSNPFGVQINLKKKLTDSLTKMAQAIGR